ncbi:MAG: WYL domain-containing protein [Lachnospiraceae bacterium]|nr:WYL domain-containing protein [Lachnospiraceae bacterium]
MNSPEFSLFSELYTCYYQVVGRILHEASRHPLTRRQMEMLARQYGYDESVLSIVPRLVEGTWPFFRQDDTSAAYVTVLRHPPFPQPLTRLQQSWLKALMSDSRFRLFFTDSQLAELTEMLSDVTPLFCTSDFFLFDQYGDPDPFSLVMYQQHFRLLLNAICDRRFLSISYLSQKGKLLSHTWLPCRLEYGQRDGKFRLYAMTFGKTGRKRIDVLNVARILSVKNTGRHYPAGIDVDCFLDHALCKKPLVLEITTERNALERALLHFSCYQKRVERLKEKDTYRCTIYYDKRWETELLIQVLSFGPVIKVLGPEDFQKQIQKRVRNQALLQQTTEGSSL